MLAPNGCCLSQKFVSFRYYNETVLLYKKISLSLSFNFLLSKFIVCVAVTVNKVDHTFLPLKRHFLAMRIVAIAQLHDRVRNVIVRLVLESYSTCYFAILHLASRFVHDHKY